MADNGDILLSPDISLTLETENASASGGIDLVSNAAEGANLVIETQGTGSFTATGSTDGTNTGNVILPEIHTDDANVDVTTNNGRVDVRGGLFAGTGNVSLAASTVDLSGDLAGGTISGTGVNQVNIKSTPAEIQDGVDIADSGATVDVAPGTYDGRVIIDKSLTLSGANAGVHAVRGSRGSESVISPGNISNDPVTAAFQTAVLVEGGLTKVTIDGFKVTNYGGGGIIMGSSDKGSEAGCAQ